MGEPFWSCDATLAKIVDRFREMHRTSGDVGSAEAKMVLTEKDVAASSSGSGAKDRGEGGDGGGRPSPGDEKKKETKPGRWRFFWTTARNTFVCAGTWRW